MITNLSIIRTAFETQISGSAMIFVLLLLILFVMMALLARMPFIIAGIFLLPAFFALFGQEGIYPMTWIIVLVFVVFGGLATYLIYTVLMGER